MPDRTQKKMTQELYQAVVGIPDNPEENGMIGDITEIKELIKSQNGRLRTNEQRVIKITGFLVGIGATIGIVLNSVIRG